MKIPPKATLYLSRLETTLGAAFPRFMLGFRHLIGYGVEPELKLLPILCDPDLVSIDIGANAGMYTYHMLKCSRMVHVFEPNQRYTKRLLRCFPKGVTVNAVALSDTNGESELRIPIGINGAGTLQDSNNFGGEYHPSDIEVIRVPMKRLDDYAYTGVGFIKIDVEGYEQTVLSGAVKTISENMPAMLIEIEERHRAGAISQVTGFLAKYGYQGFFLKNRNLVPIEQFSPEKEQSIQNLPCGYINNFVFLPPGQIGKSRAIVS